MKKIILFFKSIIFFCIMIVILLFAVQEAYAGDELYFNKSGDLVFSTYDKRATSGVRYKTVGWVIKRYDDAITAPGQYSVNIARSGFIYETIDPGNPEYIYTTFIVDGAGIMERIGGVSGQWKNQLKKYGGYVYIDSIMTVSEQGVEQGGIYNSGAIYGECYNTYAGIRHARAWADGDKLSGYFGLKVKYPVITPTMQKQFLLSTITDKKSKSMKNSSFMIGSHERENEEYDIDNGIPSGEDLYIYGSVDKFSYEADYQNVTGYVKIPVRVDTIYRLCWDDRSGCFHAEDRKVERWYYVIRRFGYNKLKNISVSDLKKVEGASAAFTDLLLGTYTGKCSYKSRTYGDSVDGYINLPAYLSYNAGIIVINSSTNQKPDIPDVNQQALAEKTISHVPVHSDMLMINGVTLLSDHECADTGDWMHEYINLPQYTIYKTGIVIPKDTKNGQGYTSSVKMMYQNGGSVSSAENHNLKKITVHTPVVAGILVEAGKENNENVSPAASDLVAGDSFLVNLGAEGVHRNIKGYGKRSYNQFIKGGYLMFPFPVEYHGKSYDGDTWIYMSGSRGVFKVQEKAREGTYTISYRTVAYNVPKEYQKMEQLECVTQQDANLDLNNYCADGSCQVQVIGKIYGLSIEDEEQHFVTGNAAVFPEKLKIGGYLPLEIVQLDTEQEDYTLSLYANALGDEAEEKIEADISYYVKEEAEDGTYIRKPVDVYWTKDQYISKENLILMENTITMEAQKARLVKEGVFCYSYEFRVPERLVIVKKGQDMKGVTMKSSCILRDCELIVNIDVYGADEKGRKLSYENAQNEKMGYCNMWKKEGWKTSDSTLQCGDVLLIRTDGMMKNKTLVIGTH